MNKNNAERRGDATPVGLGVLIYRGNLVKAELREKKRRGEGDSPGRPFLAYNLSNSQMRAADAKRYAVLPWRLMMKTMKVAFLLLSLTLQPAAGASRTEFHDFSQKGADYKPLENLRFADADVTYSGNEQIDIL